MSAEPALIRPPCGFMDSGGVFGFHNIGEVTDVMSPDRRHNSELIQSPRHARRLREGVLRPARGRAARVRGQAARARARVGRVRTAEGEA